MDRTEFLQMCQKASVLPNGICHIKQNVPDELKVVVDGIAYCPIGYKMTFNDNGDVQHTAILSDLKSNSVIECKLERVAKYEQGRSN